MIPNASITGWSSSTGPAPAGGVALSPVTWPSGRLVPCQVGEFGAVKVATLQASGLDLTKTVRVRSAGLRALGISPEVNDVVTVASYTGQGGVAYVVRAVRPAHSAGRVGAADEVVLTLGRAA